MVCIQCGYRIPDVISTCPNCSRPAETIPGELRSRPFRKLRQRQPFIDAGRWTEPDRITVTASAVLLVSLFLPWFGVSFLGMSVTADGLESHGYLRIVLMLCAAILGYLVLRVTPARSVLPPPRAHERVLLAATSINLALVVIGFLVAPGGAALGPLVSHQYGAFVAGIAALVAVAPIGAAVFSVTSRWTSL
jgi:hypothetical protein